MTNKSDLSDICTRAWAEARRIARGGNKAARAHLAEAFRNVWHRFKGELAMRAPRTSVALSREACATRSQISYIESLLGRGKSVPANLSKVAASRLIDALKARMGVGLRSEDPSFDHGWY